MDIDPNDPDVVAFREAQKRGRAASLAKSLRLGLVMMLAGGAGVGAAAAVASWDHQNKLERLERYEHGEPVFLARGEQVTNTDPSLTLVLGAGGAAGFVTFALFAVLLLRDKTYAAGIRNLVG